jgi:hypothetical protein
MPGIRRALPRD